MLYAFSFMRRPDLFENDENFQWKRNNANGMTFLLSERIIFYCFLIIGHSNGFAYDTLYTGGSFTVFV